MKISNDGVSTGFESEARTWMTGLKERIDKGGDVFRGQWVGINVDRLLLAVDFD